MNCAIEMFMREFSANSIAFDSNQKHCEKCWKWYPTFVFPFSTNGNVMIGLKCNYTWKWQGKIRKKMHNFSIKSKINCHQIETKWIQMSLTIWPYDEYIYATRTSYIHIGIEVKADCHHHWSLIIGIRLEMNVEIISSNRVSKSCWTVIPYYEWTCLWYNLFLSSFHERNSHIGF